MLRGVHCKRTGGSAVPGHSMQGIVRMCSIYHAHLRTPGSGAAWQAITVGVAKECYALGQARLPAATTPGARGMLGTLHASGSPSYGVLAPVWIFFPNRR